MRRILVGLLTLFFIGVSASAALAASPHFKKGGAPTCTVTSTSAPSSSTTCTASLAGLGNATVVVQTSVNGSAVYQCQNGGGNTAPGQNKVLVGPATSTTTIPAGDIGNDRPINIVDERWYSPDLQMTVMTKHSDPRMGETTFALKNINRASPPLYLFEVPAGYTIKTGPQVQPFRVERRE